MTEAEEIISLTARYADLKERNAKLETRLASLEKVNAAAGEALDQAVTTIEAANRAFDSYHACNMATITICELIMEGLRNGSILAKPLRSKQFRAFAKIMPELDPDNVKLEQLMELHIRVVRSLS
jgi:GTPase